MISSPTTWEGISVSPMLSSWRTMPDTIFSTRSGSTGRWRMAMAIERISFSRSKGVRRPERLTMVSSRSCTRSKVVKRPPQAGHRRRRRIAAPASDGRLSFTWLSSSPQNGQRIIRLLVDREPLAQGLDLTSHRRLDRGVALVAVFAGNAVDHFDDQLTDLLEFRDPEPAGGARRRAQADSRGDEGLFRVERDVVLVAGDRGAVERLLRQL